MKPSESVPDARKAVNGGEAGAVPARIGSPILYRRAGPPQVEGPETRTRILHLVRENPGICIQELADLMHLARNAIVYHLRRLVRAGQVSATRHGRRTSYFGLDIAAKIVRDAHTIMRLRTVRCVLENLRTNPTLGWRTLAKRLKLTPHTIRWHVARLEQAGLLHVDRRPDGAHHATIPGEVEVVFRRTSPAGANTVEVPNQGAQAAIPNSPALNATVASKKPILRDDAQGARAISAASVFKPA